MSDEIRGQIIQSMKLSLKSAVAEFHRDRPSDDIYAVAIVLAFTGDHVLAAIASEGGLNEVAHEYANRDYLFRGQKDIEALRTWLRWSNPDDGWKLSAEDKFADTNAILHAAIADGHIEAGSVGEFARQALLNIVPALVGRQTVIATTHGEDPEEFRYWVQELNLPEVIAKFEAEFALGQEIEADIDREL